MEMVRCIQIIYQAISSFRKKSTCQTKIITEAAIPPLPQGQRFPCRKDHELFLRDVDLFFVKGIIDDNDQLVWWIADNDCTYSHKNEFDEITLPFLPYDIYREKLKLYLALR
jgi:hypothetical protein